MRYALVFAAGVLLLFVGVWLRSRSVAVTNDPNPARIEQTQELPTQGAGSEISQSLTPPEASAVADRERRRTSIIRCDFRGSTAETAFSVFDSQGNRVAQVDYVPRDPEGAQPPLTIACGPGPRWFVFVDSTGPPEIKRVDAKPDRPLQFVRAKDQSPPLECVIRNGRGQLISNAPVEWETRIDLPKELTSLPGFQAYGDEVIAEFNTRVEIEDFAVGNSIVAHSRKLFGSGRFVIRMVRPTSEYRIPLARVTAPTVITLVRVPRNLSFEANPHKKTLITIPD